MALQGTLDTFALADVLRLLSATQKTGRLRIGGGRGGGSIWLTSGAVTGLEVSHAPYATEPVDALFELLRFTEGSFTFDTEVAHETPTAPVDIEELLTAAEALLAEWREIESVVPSMDAWVTLRRLLASDTVSIDRERWTTLVAVGAGASVRTVAAALELGELPVSRAVRDLVELGVAEISLVAPEAPPTADSAAHRPLHASDARPPLFGGAGGDAEVLPTAEAESSDSDPGAPEPDQATDQATDQAAEDPDALPTARPIRARRPRTTLAASDEPTEPERFVPLQLPGRGPAAYDGDAATEDATKADPEADADRSVADLSQADLTAAFPGLASHAAPELRDADGTDDEEMARQLATLSPRAAEAVRAAAGAATLEEREAALDAATDDDDDEQPINRGLLLKFLSSVKS